MSQWIVRDCGLTPRTLLAHESVFSAANGYLGVRGNFEEGYGIHANTIRGAYINGCYDTADIGYDEKLYGFPESKQVIVNIPDFQTVYLKVDGEAFDPFAGKLIFFERSVDMRRGVCTRDMEWESPLGKRVRIGITRMASFTVPELFTIDYRVTPLNFSGELRFVSEISADVANYCDAKDPRTGSSGGKSLCFSGGDIEGGILYLEARTVRAGIGVAVCAAHTINKEGRFDRTLDGMTARAAATAYANRGEEVRLTKYAYCLDTRHCDDLKGTARALAGQHTGTIDGLYEAQHAYLEGRWRIADVEIDSGDGADMSLRYCVYQLICQSACCDTSIPAKGLTGEGYEGHYFWDTEVFVEPFLSLTDPDRARTLLMYRYRTLEAARRNARILGHAKGAAYPWRTIAGSECSTYFPGGAAQYHINGDIAYAIIQYCRITGDTDFLLHEGAEILLETARLWMELGHFYKGAFHIDTVTGPDEYTGMANNNYYTNLLARHHLQWAVSVYGTLTERGETAVVDRIGLKPEEAASFEEAYRHMYLPCDEKAGITPQDDSFLRKKMWDFAGTPADHYPLLLHYHPMALYRHQVCKQADVLLAYYLFPKDHTKELMERSYGYYEKITTHDSSLSACVFSIMAARLGNVDKACDYFTKTVRLDLDDTCRNTKDGLHMANMGGSYLCVVGGLAGLSVDDIGMSLLPVLPEGWRSYRFRFLYRGSVFSVTVGEKGTEIGRISGEPQCIGLNGEKKTY